VTQSFNTSSSMGRLTLNVLLSFAQFERELIGERVRDKIGAPARRNKNASAREGRDGSRRMMANVRAERLLKNPAEPSPELRIPGTAAQTRVVSMAGIRLGSWESSPAFKGIICDDISEFESSSSQFVNTAQNGIGCPLEEVAQLSSAIRDMVG